MTRREALSHRCAFTLIEVLVVIGIIAVLIGMLLPALGSARNSALKARELSNLRQIGAGWTLYTNQSNNRILPGYLAESVQEKWRVTYPVRYDDSTVPKDLAQSYPFRLLPFMDDQYVLLREYLSERNDDPRSDMTGIALNPAYGYNATYLGGWYEGVGQDGQMIVRFEASNVIARTMNEITRSDEMIVFCSSAVRAAGDRYSKVIENVPGSHEVVPPIVARTPQWTGEGTTLHVLQSAPVPVMRYTSQIALLHADGHTASETPGGVFDQRRWIPRAETSDFTHEP